MPSVVAELPHLAVHAAKIIRFPFRNADALRGAAAFTFAFKCLPGQAVTTCARRTFRFHWDGKAFAQYAFNKSWLDQ
jgi:hypothetical protein